MGIDSEKRIAINGEGEVDAGEENLDRGRAADLEVSEDAFLATQLELCHRLHAHEDVHDAEHRGVQLQPGDERDLIEREVLVGPALIDQVLRMWTPDDAEGDRDRAVGDADI